MQTLKTSFHENIESVILNVLINYLKDRIRIVYSH